jgi:hypothetical protein
MVPTRAGQQLTDAGLVLTLISGQSPDPKGGAKVAKPLDAKLAAVG